MKGLTLKEAAIRAGVTTQRIHQLAGEGKVRFTQTPYGRLFWQGDIERYAKKRKERDRQATATRAKKAKGAA